MSTDLATPEQLAGLIVSYAEAIVQREGSKWSYRALALAADCSPEMIGLLRKSAKGERAYQYETAYRLLSFMRERFPELEPKAEAA